ncbi:MAG: porin [Casimicrobium sp.]|jgi:hypothetical protein
MNQLKYIVGCLALSASVTGLASAQEVEPFAITPYADVRYRLELVDQDGLAEDATASTLRVRAGLRSAEWNGFSGVIEGEAILRLGKPRYNDTVNGLTAYPVVADPSDVLLNQAYIRWKTDAAVEVTAGRQAVNLDNQRWIGSVGWRQNDQTLDAARVTLKPLKSMTFDYLYAWRVNRVFGPDSSQGIWRGTAINGVRAGYTIDGIGTILGYGYWLDIPSQSSASSRTLGVRIAGERPVGKGLKFLYAAEYARQQDFAANPRSFALDYLLLEPGLSYGPFTLRGGLERLEGDGTAAVQTPLATLHAFNGWADKFLATPANGLRDIYLDASYRIPANKPLAGLILRGVLHDYRSTRAGLHYGSEWNAHVSYPVTKKLTVSAKFARYDADVFSTDTTKIWLALDAKF